MHPSPAPAAATPSAPRNATVRRAERIVVAVLFVLSASLLAAAAWLDPAPAGMGTHQQFGLPPCSLLVATGYPCATCGMTTAFANAADGRLLTAFQVQPMGALLAIIAAATVIVTGYALIVGISLAPLGEAVFRGKTFVLLAVFTLAAWGYKILLVRGAF
jgi:hypothetical protein